MRISRSLALAVPLAALTFGCNAPRVLAQETLAGVGAASGMGATLGAAASSGIANRTPRNLGQTNGLIQDAGDPGLGGSSGMAGSGAGAGAGAVSKGAALPPLAVQPGSGRELLGQLLAGPRDIRPIPENVKRSPRAQAAYSRKLARMTPAQRKRMVLNKYKIAPINWLGAYLPADRYKFSKAWKFVSTETDRFYYTPQGMTRKKFTASRVIGFRTWQEAMLAGYRPDPYTKPEPGNQLAFLASLTQDDPLLQMVEYAYAGQISPAALTQTYNYVRQVKAVVDKHPHVRQYQRETVNAILTAALTGDSSGIPTVFGEAPVIQASGVQPSAGGDLAPAMPADGGSLSPSASPSVPQGNQ